MPVRPLIWICFLMFCNDVNCLTSSNEDQTITLEECLRMLPENSSVIQSQMKPKSKCETNGCVKVAAQILDYIDSNLDQCENFYQFANGRFINETTSETEDDESQSLYSTVSDLVNKKVGPLLSEPIQPNEWKPFQLAKNFYASCVNQKIIVRRGNQELIDLLDALEGWPAVKGSSWLSREFDLIRLMGKVKELGFDTDIIFDVSVDVDPKNTTNRVLHISSGSYEMDEDNSKKGLAKYRQKMFQKSAIFTDKKDEKAKVRIRKEMEKVWSFEKMLSEISSDTDDDEDESDDADTNTENAIDSDDVEDDSDEEDGSDPVYSIKQLQESYPYLNWLDYINALLPSGLNVTEDEPVVNMSPQFFERLAKVMNATSERTMANYIVWRAVYSAYKLQTFESGKARRGKCINLTSKIFSIPVGILYSRKYFNENSRQAVISLVEDVRQAFIDILAGVTWMDEVTRQKAISKAENIIAHVGYPNELYENDGLEEYYAELEMEPDTFFKNNLRWNLFSLNHQLNSLRQPVNRSGWEEVLDLDPTEANAFYDPSRNSMQFPIAILHELFFAMDRPQYINYASLGNTVGHEITHGFDDNGRKYDLNGNLINWWNAEARRKFSKEAECFIDQYNHYTDPKTNLTVDGDYTLNENMADNGGTRAAYYAYLNWIQRNGAESLVPGVKYNQKQLFWISYAQAESSVDGQTSFTYLIENDSHAPNEFRVNGVVSNLQEFANDFNCPVGTKMNPLKKCRVW
ncbi:neprilysin-2-like [Bradysia coprophila]|uniref:neprilysin-2-like n=1 Tax=Bradysia coprophila TaxID=38358 RepID=UPI00187DC890|nr:neprilysin-2-like [Bradysia coprophila]